MILPDGSEAHEWNIGTLHQGMRMKGEDGPVVVLTPQGEVEVFDRDWVITRPDGSQAVVRKGTSQALGWAC